MQLIKTTATIWMAEWHDIVIAKYSAALWYTLKAHSFHQMTTQRWDVLITDIFYFHLSFALLFVSNSIWYLSLGNSDNAKGFEQWYHCPYIIFICFEMTETSNNDDNSSFSLINLSFIHSFTLSNIHSKLW